MGYNLWKWAAKDTHAKKVGNHWPSEWASPAEIMKLAGTEYSEMHLIHEEKKAFWALICSCVPFFHWMFAMKLDLFVFIQFWHEKMPPIQLRCLKRHNVASKFRAELFFTCTRIKMMGEEAYFHSPRISPHPKSKLFLPPSLHMVINKNVQLSVLQIWLTVL